MINWFEMLCLGSNLYCQKIKWVVSEEAIHWEYVHYVEIDLHEWDLKASQRVQELDYSKNRKPKVLFFKPVCQNKYSMNSVSVSTIPEPP